MNRQSLFGRLAPSRAAQRAEFFRVHLETLEDRKMLAVNTFVANTWTEVNTEDNPADGILVIGDLLDDGNGHIGQYGSVAFGKVSGTNVSTVAGGGLIKDAIFNTSAGGTVNIQAGTYIESDIVIDHALTLDGTGSTGLGRSLIVPEVTSTDAEGDFPAGSRQGIIINAASVTVQELALDGSGNGKNHDYHNGITTVYGTTYTPIRNAAIDGAVNIGGHDSDPAIVVQNTVVSNTFWHGITLSGAASETIGANRIRNNSVNDVGLSADRADSVKGLNRIGILMQNNDHSEVRTNTVSLAGVGIATGVLGTASFDNSNAARNRAGLAYNTVTNALQRGFSINFQGGALDIETLVVIQAQVFEEGFVANTANYTLGSNTAIGWYFNHSQPVVTGGFVTGYNTGAKIQNTTLTGLIAPVFAGSTITGPGTGVASSVGILAENSVDQPDSVFFGITGGTTVTGYAVGLKSNQLVPAATPNGVSVDRAALNGNTTAIVMGVNAQYNGAVSTTGLFDGTGVGSLVRPGFINNGLAANHVPTGDDNTPAVDTTFMPEDADIYSTGNATLGNRSTYSPIMTGQSAASVLFDFDEFEEYTEYVGLPPAPSGSTDQPFIGANSWIGAVTQTGMDGKLHIGAPAVNGNFGLLAGFNGHQGAGVGDPEDPGYEDPTQFYFESIDITGSSKLNIVAKTDAGNASSVFSVGLIDDRGGLEFWSVPMTALNSSTYTTVSVNLLALGIPLGQDGGFDEEPSSVDFSHIVGYIVLGDLGLQTGVQTNAFRMSIDEISVSSIRNSNLDVTGTVAPGNAFLAPRLAAGYNPTSGSIYNIINNDGADAVSGTFGGLANGSIVAGSGRNWTVNYNSSGSVVNGLGNDTTLTIGGTNTAPVVDANGPGGGIDRTTTWNVGGGPVAVADAAAATVTDDGSILTGATATLTAPVTGDVLSATPTGNITVSYNAGTGTLTLTGSDTKANYQTVLRSITYNNTVGNPGSARTVTIVGNDGDLPSTGAVVTINIGVAGSSIVARKLFYNQSKFDGNNAAVGTQDDAAIATDKVAYIPGAGAATFGNVSSYTKGINGIMIDISGVHGTITAADFKFKMGNNSTPSSWNAVVPAPTNVTTRSLGGGVDRITITWANNAIYKNWLEVQMKGNDALGGNNTNTGLAATSVFFWGNAPGDTGAGDTATRALVNATDELDIRGHQLLAGATVTNVWDIDRTGNVGATEQLFVRGNGTIAGNAVQYITVAGAGPFAPEGDGDDGAVASALALTSGGGGGGAQLPRWLAGALQRVDLNSGPAAAWIHALANSNSPAAHKVLVAADHLADRLGLDTTLLDEVLDDLGL